MIPAADFIFAIDRIPSSVYVMHEKNEFRLPEHAHNKGQLIYIEGGVAYIHLTNKTLIIPARHYVWIPKGLRHFIEMHKSVIIISLYFYADDDDDHPFFNKGGIYPINTLLMQMLAYSEKWEGDVLPGDKAFPFLAGIKNILPEISRKALPIALPTTENERMQPVLAYISKHLFDTLTLTSVSSKMGFSERTLSRLFQSTMRISFLQYFKLLRMVKAIEMMLQTDKSISEIAYTLGYNNVSAFSNIFYQLTKIRPSEFAKQLQL
ncbi:helix-turn-helix domain-containing protein [Mucilaginibacter sp. SP1R1]|uniref:helix-turn-helix domain-containing protein n=1 Tax=Mucilaginibacter sp. SP1R1 TaxID=2723091 RepID=UPI0016154148|nr:AraC family transcriptional regulator [Mucilaginibacter sp. SP1R1]MBB6152623.1 AraC-like DNA-binding protein [Mucilaginibacter sp. SP1R1]